MLKLGDGPVRCLLVRPEFLENTFYNPRDVFRLLGGKSAAPPLGLLTVAAHLPDAWALRFVDGDIEPITDAHLVWAEVILISCKGPQEIPVRRLVERARLFGVTVIVGGAGPTLQPDLFAGIADYVVAGEAEPVLPELRGCRRGFIGRRGRPISAARPCPGTTWRSSISTCSWA